MQQHHHQSNIFFSILNFLFYFMCYCKLLKALLAKKENYNRKSVLVLQINLYTNFSIRQCSILTQKISRLAHGSLQLANFSLDSSKLISAYYLIVKLHEFIANVIMLLAYKIALFWYWCKKMHLYALLFFWFTKSGIIK